MQTKDLQFHFYRDTQPTPNVARWFVINESSLHII